MVYVLGVFIPFVAQLLTVFLIIQMNTGNGSWVGLGAFLIGVPAIPLTAAANFALIRSSAEDRPRAILLRGLGVAAVAPVLILLMLIF